MNRTEQPDHYEGVPESGLVPHEIAVGVCHDCEEVVGPTFAEDVGQAFSLNHATHETELIAEWTNTQVVPEVFFDAQ